MCREQKEIENHWTKVTSTKTSQNALSEYGLRDLPRVDPQNTEKNYYNLSQKILASSFIITSKLKKIHLKRILNTFVLPLGVLN